MAMITMLVIIKTRSISGSGSRWSEQGKRSHLSQFNHKQIEVLMADNDGTGEKDDGDDSNDESLQVQL